MGGAVGEEERGEVDDRGEFPLLGVIFRWLYVSSAGSVGGLLGAAGDSRLK